jgi:hypothetical protein
MDKWEYLDVDSIWDSKKKKWTASWSGNSVEGTKLRDIFNQLGAQGWELVTMNVTKLYATHDAWETNTSTVAYWAFLKRPC